LQARSQCERCHPGRNYRTGKRTCVDCHEDSTEASSGRTASSATRHSCASTRSSPGFPHPWFRFEGKHRVTAAAPAIPRSIQDRQACLFRLSPEGRPAQNQARQGLRQVSYPGQGGPQVQPRAHDRFPRTARTSKRTARIATSRALRPQPLTWQNGRPCPTSPWIVRFRCGHRCIDCHTDPHRGYVGTSCANATRLRVSGRLRARGPGWSSRSITRRVAAPPRRSANQRQPAGRGGRQCAFCHGSPSCRHCTAPIPATHTGLWRLKTTALRRLRPDPLSELPPGLVLHQFIEGRPRSAIEAPGARPTLCRRRVRPRQLHGLSPTSGLCALPPQR